MDTYIEPQVIQNPSAEEPNSPVATIPNKRNWWKWVTLLLILFIFVFCVPLPQRSEIICSEAGSGCNEYQWIFGETLYERISDLFLPPPEPTPGVY